MPDTRDSDQRPATDWPDMPQADPDVAQADPPPPPAVPGPARPPVDTGSKVQPGRPSDERGR
jgi:hypothetical protein